VPTATPVIATAMPTTSRRSSCSPSTRNAITAVTGGIRKNTLDDDPAHDRLAVAVADHDLDHATYVDEHKQVADHGWWELRDRTERRFVLDLHGERDVRRYALIRTGRAGAEDWLLHLTKEQPGQPGA